MLLVSGVSTAGDDGLQAVRQVSLEVHRGEILGIAGVSGNGQTELAEVINGIRPASQGSVSINGKDTTHTSASDISQLGVAYIPDKARQHAVMLGLSLEQNCLLKSQNSPPFSRRHVLSLKKVGEHTERLLQKADVRYTTREEPARMLSGGNLQKLIVARELAREPELIVAVNPTMGVDVGAIEQIHQNLLQQRKNNKAILLISTELDELLSLSDRIAVMCGGRITGFVDPKKSTAEEIGLLMGGADSSATAADRAGAAAAPASESISPAPIA